MNQNNLMKRMMLLGVAAALGVTLYGPVAGPAQAHETTCPVCRLDVVQDTKEQDNEVAIRYGRKRIEYRCVYCALYQAHNTFQGDLTLLAPSELKGKHIVLTRKDGKWTSSPANPVFVGERVVHRNCQTGYRAFTTKAAFDDHVKKNQNVLRNAKPLTLAEVLEISKQRR
jgi:hypothetical protein